MTKKSVIGIVESNTQAESIVVALQAQGVPGTEISVLLPDKDGSRDFAHQHKTKAPEGAVAGASTGGVIGGGLGLLAGIGALVVPGVGPLIAAGPLMAALSGAAAGAAVGGVTGGLIGLGIPEIEAKLYEGKIRGGNILIATHVESSAEEKKVRELFELNGAHDVVTTSESSVPKHAGAPPLVLLAVLGALGMFGGVLSSCDSETRVDCTSICDRYKDCFDDNYDADECADNCVAHADDKDRQKAVELCDTCIDDESCTEAAFKCGDECIGIVP